MTINCGDKVKGKQKRMKNILSDGKAILVAMDHGLSDGPSTGLINIENTIADVASGGASGVILHKGIIKSLKRVPETGLILHASAGTSIQLDPNDKRLVASVKEAIKLGVDGFSLHINIGGAPHEPDMIQKLGLIAEECDNWEIPLIAMMYPRGKNITKNSEFAKMVSLVSRVGAELGADIIKTNYTGDIDSFSKVVEGCPVPVVIAGGPKIDSNRQLLQMVSDCLEAGAIGVTLGRNIFSHTNPYLITKAIAGIVKDGWSVEKEIDLVEL